MNARRGTAASVLFVAAFACALALATLVPRPAAAGSAPPVLVPGVRIGSLTGRPSLFAPASVHATFRVPPLDDIVFVVGGWSTSSLTVVLVYPDHVVALTARDDLPGRTYGVRLPADVERALRVEVTAQVVRSGGIPRLVTAEALAGRIAGGWPWIALTGFLLALAVVFGVMGLVLRAVTAGWYALLLAAEAALQLPAIAVVRPAPLVGQPLHAALLGLVAFAAVGFSATYLGRRVFGTPLVVAGCALAALETLHAAGNNLWENVWPVPGWMAVNAIVPFSLAAVGARAVRRPFDGAFWYAGAMLLAGGAFVVQDVAGPENAGSAAAYALQAVFLALAVGVVLREREHQRMRLERLAHADGLTGLANRTAFDDQLATAWDRAGRSAAPLAALMIDVDEFKRYNDTNGHLAGDEVLRRIAAQIAGAASRRDDVAARYGGEEFVVLLPATDREAAAAIAERVRGAIAALAIPHRVPAGRVTISVGVAALRGDPSRPAEELIARADAALYLAKTRGRDRVAVDEFADPSRAPAVDVEGVD